MEKRPVLCSILDVCARIGQQTILENARFTVHETERVGVLGNNGRGKSTLLRVISGVMPPDTGEVKRRRGLITGYLPQEAVFQQQASIREAILDGARDLLEELARFEALPPNAEEAHQLEDNLLKRGAWELDRRIEELASHLALPDINRSTEDLSGGERRRVALARTLIGAPDLLLLDEPTNHLDTDSIAWLETWLIRQRCSCLFVTHDRAFLDDVSTSILEIHNGNLYRHEGNYRAFVENKANREAVEARTEDKRQAFLRREVEWIRRGPKARTTKSQSRIDRFNQAAAQSPSPQVGSVELIIPPASRMGRRVLDLINVDIAIDGNILVRDFSFSFEPGQRIGVVGPNGIGKTTFLKTILGEHSPSKGKIVYGKLTRFNYADQQRQRLNDNNDAFTEIAEGKEAVQLGDQQVSVWSYLKRFLFTDERIRTRVGHLSGGERNRLMLAKILKYGGNFLILDEPTNDLDLDTLRILEEALADFVGCVLAVSHDRYFLNRICTGIMAFEGDRSLIYQAGDYDYYLTKKSDRELRDQNQNQAPSSTPAAKPDSQRKSRKQRKLKWKERRELESMENDIITAEAEVERLVNLFASPDFFRKHGSKTQELTAELQAARDHVNTLYARWQELEAIREN